MIGALLLTLALLVAPDASRARLMAPKSAVQNRISLGIVAWAVAAASVAGMALWLPPPVAAAAVVVATTVVIRHRRARRRRQQIDEAVALQGALGVLVGELRAGAHPVTAFEAAAGESAGAVGAGLREVAARARFGADVATGLTDVARGSVLAPYWQRLAICWRLAQDHGLAIAPLMRAAESDVVARQKYSSRLRSGMAGARASAGVLAGLPLLGIALGQLIGADPLRFLLGDGAVVLLIGVVLSCLGVLWSDRITEVVPR